MSGSGRKTSAKWDSRDEPEFASYSVANRDSSKWSNLERTDKLNPRMGFSCKEPFSAGRGSNKDDITNKDYRVLDPTNARDTDGSYSMEMSPGSEDCKNKYSQSPKNGYSRSVRSHRSRSRSRSPPRSFRRDSGVNDRYRMRIQPCRDFAAGKCRRGSQCHFLHHDNQNYEDGWESRHRHDGTPRYSAPHESGDYSRTSGRSNDTCINYAKGRCRMGASCKYAHHENSDQFSKVSVDESTREREIDRRHPEGSFEHVGRHTTNHNGDIPCKFFAFGNCRNGKHCRFSHDRQACGSPNRRFGDDRLRSSQGGDQALDRPKLTGEVSPNGRLRDDKWSLDGGMADENKVWGGSKENDLVVVSNIAKLVEDNRNFMGTPEPGFTTWPISDGWDHSLDNKNRVHGESPFSSDMKEANWTAKSDSSNIHTSQSVGADIWPGNEKMSPDWNYGVGSSTHIKEEHGQSNQQVVPGQVFHQNVNALHSSSCLAVGQGQGAASNVTPRVRTVDCIQNQEVSAEKKYIVEPTIQDVNASQVGSRNPLTQNMVSKEQLAQLTNLSASLAHILGAGQQLPQLYATSISLDAKDTPFLSKTEGSGNPVSITSIKPDPAVGFQKQCDPKCSSGEPNNANSNGVPSTSSPSKNILKDSAEIPSLLSKLGQHFDESNSKPAFSEEQFVKSEHSVQLQKGENVEVNKENKVVADEKQSSPFENKITEENGPMKNLDQNSGPDEAKKTKDVKGIRAFKFSLVEFVKELLKPTWKDGKITKEDYKAIVKKVTDKVTGTVQRGHIPQTQEKIDRYLSLSKPKVNKLIQAYVEKVQKA